MVVVAYIQHDIKEKALFGVFESREKWLEEVKPHLERRGVTGPINWAFIEAGSKVLTAEEVELNEFQDWI